MYGVINNLSTAIVNGQVRLVENIFTGANAQLHELWANIQTMFVPIGIGMLIWAGFSILGDGGTGQGWRKGRSILLATFVAAFIVFGAEKIMDTIQTLVEIPQ